MEGYEIIAAADPNPEFDRWVAALQRAGIDAKQMKIADYDTESGYAPYPHPRGSEVYLLVRREQLEEALTIIEGTIG